MKPAKSFQALVVWQKAHVPVLDVYRLTAAFPRTETYGRTSRIRRAAVSIPADIAEGFKKRGLSDKMRMKNISQGSAEEVKYYLILAKDPGDAETDELQQKLDDVCRLLGSYIQGIARRNS